ncbi:MAG: Clp1/GlmU family protein [Candidatus Freyarchaeum deiterrae]
MKKVVEARPNQTLLVKGPAKIDIVKGEISILENNLGEGESIVITRGKALPIKAVSETVLDSYIDNDDAVEPLEEQFPKEWIGVTNLFENLELPTLIPILGSVDSGKTSLTTYLANNAFKKGYRVAIVDADVGQSNIGQPCFVSMGFMEKTVSMLSEVKLKGTYFIGSNTPSRLLHRTITGVAVMVKKALDNNAEIVFVDTAGWVYGRGARELEASLISMLQPRILIALQRGNEIEHLLSPFNESLVNIVRLPAPRTYKRSRENRKFLREISYQKGLQGGRDITLSLEQINLRYTLLGSGSQVKPEKFEEIKRILGCLPIYIEESTDILYIVLPDYEIRINKDITEYLEDQLYKTEVYLTQKRDFENVLVAFQDENNEPLNIGIIKRIDFEKREITFYTSADKEKIRSAQFGLLKVSEDGEELGYTKIL